MAIKTVWYNLPQEINKILESLITKINDSSCFDSTELESIKKSNSWSDIPNRIDSVINYLKVNQYPTEIAKPRWYKLPSTIDELKALVEVFDCNNTPDTEAPTVPQNLVASNITSTSVKLDWNVSTDDRGVVNYIIYRDGVQTATRVGNTASLSGLTPSTTYAYTVSAIDAAGNESAQSAIESVTTLA